MFEKCSQRIACRWDQGVQAEVLDDSDLTPDAAQSLSKTGAASCIVMFRESCLDTPLVKVGGSCRLLACVIL